jgi:hypothetical protein
MITTLISLKKNIDKKIYKKSFTMTGINHMNDQRQVRSDICG